MKKLLIILCALLSAAACTFAFTACGGEENSGGYTAGGYTGGDLISIYGLYPCYQDSSFAKLKILSIDDNIYCRVVNEDERCILAECIVEDDYYDNLESGTTVYLPIILNKTNGGNEYYDKSSLKEWLLENDYIISFFYKISGTFDLKNLESGEYCDIEYKVYFCNIKYDLIPVNEEKADITCLDRWLESQGEPNIQFRDWSGYTEYIDDGMTIEEVSENLRKLAVEAQ